MSKGYRPLEIVCGAGGGGLESLKCFIGTKLLASLRFLSPDNTLYIDHGSRQRYNSSDSLDSLFAMSQGQCFIAVFVLLLKV